MKKGLFLTFVYLKPKCYTTIDRIYSRSVALFSSLRQWELLFVTLASVLSLARVLSQCRRRGGCLSGGATVRKCGIDRESACRWEHRAQRDRDDRFDLRCLCMSVLYQRGHVEARLCDTIRCTYNYITYGDIYSRGWGYVWDSLSRCINNSRRVATALCDCAVTVSVLLFPSLIPHSTIPQAIPLSNHSPE